jgi:dihydroorotate dehydrogenase
MLYTRIARPLLFRLEPEHTHRYAIRTGRFLSRHAGARRVLRRLYDVQFPELAVEAFGLRFKNPVGLSAGFDKNAELHPIIADLGFGHLEVGSVSLRSWRGNPSPTLLRLPADGALINRLGLNSQGSEAVYRRLRQMPAEIPIGINVVKTADPAISGLEAIDDYLQGFTRFEPAADFVTLNLSCPNSADGQTFQDPALLAPLLQALRQTHGRGAPGKPLLIKLSPDLDDDTLRAVLKVAAEYGVDGCVIGNTTSRREGLRTPPDELERFGFGGLSGRPLKPLARQLIGKVRRLTGGRMTIIACGGVGCDPQVDPAEEVWEYLNLGATLVQLYTGLIYRGPGICKQINEGLVGILRRNKLPTLADFLRRRDG